MSPNWIFNNDFVKISLPRLYIIDGKTNRTWSFTCFVSSDRWKSLRKALRLKRYMLFSLARSLMTKNRVLPLSARGKYASRSCHIKKETKHVNETTIQGNRRWHQSLIKLILICSNRKNWKRYKSVTIWNLLLGLQNLKDYDIKGAYGKRMESEFFNFESPFQTDKCLLSRDSSAKLSLLCFNTYHDLETKSAVNKFILQKSSCDSPDPA